VTDNDSRSARDEGSLIFAGHPAFVDLPYGTRIRVIATESVGNGARIPRDDLEVWDRLLVVYVGNGHLDGDVDPWFDLGVEDNLALLSPGRGPGFEDDQGIAFLSDSVAVMPESFGVPVDSLVEESSFDTGQR
jgi:hypothetical protein